MNIKIGLELHITLQTKTKLFSAASQSLSSVPNSNTDLIDWGYPGALPQINIEAVKLGYQLGYMLHCQLDDMIVFDRKHYYYFDLPKGFQLTQYFRPLGQKGYFDLFLSDNTWKKIPIVSAHLEEDTAQTIHHQNMLLINYNRAGNSLLEVTTAPVFTNFLEIKLFLNQMTRLLKTHQLSSANFAQGAIRIDVNISSIHHIDNQTIEHVRNEIKNLNNIANIKKVIEQEIIIQKANVAAQSKMLNISLTKKFDEHRQKLVVLRNKFAKIDYMFIRDNNILPIKLSSILRKSWVQHLPNPDSERHLVDQYQLSFEQADKLFRHNLTNWFEFLVAKQIQLKNIFVFFQEVLIPLQTNYPILFTKQPQTFQYAEKLLTKYQLKPFNWQIVKQIFFRMLNEVNFNWTSELQKLLKPVYLTNDETIQLLLDVLKIHPDIQKRYFKNSKTTTNFLFGQMQKRSSIKLNPSLVLAIIQKHFRE